MASPPADRGSGGVAHQRQYNAARFAQGSACAADPLPVARVRGFERTRSNTIATATVATPPRSSSRREVGASPQPEVFRASPSVRDRYGLRDASQSPAAVSDAEVLGVIDCIPQQSPRHPSPKVLANMETKEVKVDGRNVEPIQGAADSPGTESAKNGQVESHHDVKCARGDGEEARLCPSHHHHHQRASRSEECLGENHPLQHARCV